MKGNDLLCNNSLIKDWAVNACQFLDLPLTSCISVLMYKVNLQSVSKFWLKILALYALITRGMIKLRCVENM